MRQLPVISKAMTAAAFLILCSCKQGGNVVGQDRVTLAEVRASRVNIKNLELKVLDIRTPDGTTHKELSVAFVAEGDALKQYQPGFKYVCALAERGFTDGTLFSGNKPIDGKQELMLPLRSLNTFLSSVKSTEPAVCEIELLLRERGVTPPAPEPPPAQLSIGKACYRLEGTKRSLVDGACPAELLNRKPLSTTSIASPRLLATRWSQLLMPSRFVLIPGVVLTLNRPLEANKPAIRVAMTCKDEKLEERFSLGRGHLAGLAQGETVWVYLPLFGLKNLAAPAKTCELSMQVQEDAAITESVQYCITGDTFKQGPCS